MHACFMIDILHLTVIIVCLTLAKFVKKKKNAAFVCTYSDAILSYSINNLIQRGREIKQEICIQRSVYQRTKCHGEANGITCRGGQKRDS